MACFDEFPENLSWVGLHFLQPNFEYVSEISVTPQISYSERFFKLVNINNYHDESHNYIHIPRTISQAKLILLMVICISSNVIYVFFIRMRVIFFVNPNSRIILIHIIVIIPYEDIRRSFI